MTDRTEPAEGPVFVVVETPYDTYRIRAVCGSRHDAERLVRAHNDQTDFPLHIHEVPVSLKWTGIGWEDGWEETL